MVTATTKARKEIARTNKNHTVSVRSPRLFIASSSETLGTAEAIQRELAGHGVSSTVWNTAFQLSRTNIENLESIAAQMSGAVFVMGSEDVQVIRERTLSATRDNVLFELGLFVGKLGRSHCSIVRPRLKDWRWPSDLDGVSAIDLAEQAFQPAASSRAASATKRASRSLRNSDSSRGRVAAEIRRAAKRLADHFATVERLRWGQVRSDVGYFLRAVRDTYGLRVARISRPKSIPRFRLNVMTPLADRTLSIACVDYESEFHEREFDKRWSEGEGKCGYAWKHGVQALYGSDLEVADAAKVSMKEADLPPTARNRRSVLSTPLIWNGTPVGVLNFDSGSPARETFVHEDMIRECFVIAASRIAGLLHGHR